MSDTAPSFGGQAYTSQTSKALDSITESPGPDLSDGEQQFVSMLSRHDYQIKFLAQNDQQLQVGVNQATSNPIQQIQQFIADIQVLTSGASLPKGALDFGDLQYILPAIGALFGFGTGTYPINLFQAAEKFFFGYVVPTQQYTDLQIAGFNSWASQLGIDPQFVKDMDSLTQAFGDLFNGLQNLGPSLASLFDELGISGTDLGPLGQLLAPILKWFAPIDFSKFGSMIEWLTDAIDPWVTGLTAVVNWVDALLAAFGAGGDVVNSPLPDVTRPFSNLIKLFATLNFNDPQFQTIQGWEQLFTSIFVNLKEFDEGVWAALGGATDIPISAITNSQPNLLYNADFEGAISIAPSSDWSWDPTTYFSADAIPGSAKLTADSHGHGLRSNLIRLGVGQILNLRVRVLTSGLIATGQPLTLDVVMFSNGTQIGVSNIASSAAPTGDASDWFAAPSGANDGLLQGTFMMPDSADSIMIRLGVAATATAGDVWFDDTAAALTGGLVADLLDDFNRGSAAFTQLWTSITTAALSYTDWTTFAAAFNSAVQTYVTTMSGLEADEVVTIEQLLNSLIPGLFPTGSNQPTGFFDQISAFLQKLFGSATFTGDLTAIAAPAVADTLHTPQVVPNFPNAASIATTGWASGGWSWDATVSWEGSPGSAKVVADGTLKAMAGVMVPVQPGQTVAVGQTTTDGSAITTAPVVQWAALAAASGVPIQFQLIPYSGEQGSWVAGTPFVVAQSISLTPDQASWLPLSLVTDSGNHVAAGIYTVPSSGVTAVQARLVVDAITTAGSAWWNNCQLVIAGGYLPTLSDDLARLKSDGEAATAATQTFLQAIQSAITEYTDWPTFITTLQSAYQTWVETESGLAADEFATLQQMLESAFGIDTSTGLNTQWASVMAQVTALQTLLSSPPVSAADWAAWWTTTLEDLGLDSTTATNTANFLSGNYQTAIDANAWATRLTNDLLVLLDVFHSTYTSMQWDAAWSDLLSLFGIVNSTTTPTTPSPTIGPAITSAQATANTANTNAGTAQTTANTGNTNTGTFLGYTRILSDVFHLIYPAGSPADTPTTTIGGLPTWYSAWNGLLVLEGLVKSTTAPIDTAPTTGTVIQANTAAATTAGTNASIAIASNQATNDAIVSATTGSPVTGTSTTDVTTGLSNIPATNIVGGAGAAVTFGAVGAGNNTNLSGASSGSISWSHTIATGDLCVLVLVCYSVGAGGTGYTSSATYGGAAMTMLQRQASSVSGGAAFDVTEAWVLKAPASGSKTVAVSLGGSASINTFSANSASYSASKIGTVGPNTGGGSSTLSMSASSATGKMVVGAFGVSGNFSGLPTLSAFNQTSRYNARGLVFGDAAGAGSVSFTATASGTATNVQWAGITVELTN